MFMHLGAVVAALFGPHDLHLRLVAAIYHFLVPLHPMSVSSIRHDETSHFSPGHYLVIGPHVGFGFQLTQSSVISTDAFLASTQEEVVYPPRFLQFIRVCLDHEQLDVPPLCIAQHRTAPSASVVFGPLRTEYSTDFRNLFRTLPTEWQLECVVFPPTG